MGTSLGRLFRVAVILVVMGTGFDMGGAAQDANGTPVVPDAPVIRTLDDASGHDFILVNIADASGTVRTFAPGAGICLQVVVNPPLTSSGPVLSSPCYSELPGQTQLGARPGIPFPSSSTYSLAVASITTDCTVRLPGPTFQDFGESGSYVVFNVTATCADRAFPTVAIPSPTRVAPLPTLALPTPTPTIDPTTPTDTPPVVGYERVSLRFVPTNPGVTPPILAGEICARIVADPPLAGDALVDHCHTRSTAIKDYFPTARTSFPMASLYSSVVASNDSGCTATPGAFREYLADFGEAAELDILITCGGSSTTPAPSATSSALTPTPSPAADAYYQIELRYVPANDRTPAVLSGNVCVQIVAEPALAVTELEEFCQGTAFAQRYYRPVRETGFPAASRYSAQVVSNGSDCTATPRSLVEIDGEHGLMAKLEVVIACPEPTPVSTVGPTEAPAAGHDAVHVELRDASGGYRYYDAPICFDVAISPVANVTGNEWVCRYYASATGSALTIEPGPDDLPATSAYTANVFTNETGCAASQSFRTEGSMGYITILTTCPDPESYASVRLNLIDAAGEEHVALGGELCLVTEVDPPRASGERLGEMCVDAAEASDTYFPSDGDPFLTSGRYSVRIASNDSSCTAGDAIQSLESGEGDLHLSLTVAVSCDVTPPTMPPSPTVIATSTPTGPAGTPKPSPTLVVTASVTGTATSTPMAATPPEPTASAPMHGSSTPSGTVAISGLPTTGSGTWEGGLTGPLVLAGIIALGLLGVSALGSRWRR